VGSQSTTKVTANRWFVLAVLILCGEVIFALPYHIPRFFRPTFLDTFGLTNGQLGDVFAYFGVVALLAYLPGGLLADRFSARVLIVWALLLTALGGFYLT
jgi:nitrate/nitrite transporter NarK